MHVRILKGGYGAPFRAVVEAHESRSGNIALAREALSRAWCDGNPLVVLTKKQFGQVSVEGLRGRLSPYVQTDDSPSVEDLVQRAADELARLRDITGGVAYTEQDLADLAEDELGALIGRVSSLRAAR